MGQRQLPDDFKDFFRSLNLNKVRYLLVGGWAVGIYGTPRATKDIDILIAMDDGNLSLLSKALGDFGAPTTEISQLRERGNVFRMGRSPVQIDIINEATGIDIEECYPRRNVMVIDDVAVSVISKEDLVANKKAIGRNRDLADVDDLEGI